MVGYSTPSYNLLHIYVAFYCVLGNQYYAKTQGSQQYSIKAKDLLRTNTVHLPFSLQAGRVPCSEHLTSGSRERKGETTVTNARQTKLRVVLNT